MARYWSVLYNISEGDVFLFSSTIPCGHWNLFCSGHCQFYVYHKRHYDHNQNAAFSSSWCCEDVCLVPRKMYDDIFRVHNRAACYPLVFIWSRNDWPVEWLHKSVLHAGEMVSRKMWLFPQQSQHYAHFCFNRGSDDAWRDCDGFWVDAKSWVFGLKIGSDSMLLEHKITGYKYSFVLRGHKIFSWRWIFYPTMKF